MKLGSNSIRVQLKTLKKLIQLNVKVLRQNRLSGSNRCQKCFVYR